MGNQKQRLVLEAVIIKLTNKINLPNGLAHPLDESNAKELLRALRQHGISTPFDEVFQICRNNEWEERHAKAFAEMADRVNSGGRLQVAHPRDWGETTLQRVLDELKD